MTTTLMNHGRSWDYLLRYNAPANWKGLPYPRSCLRLFGGTISIMYFKI